MSGWVCLDHHSLLSFLVDGHRHLDPVGDIASADNVALAQIALFRDMEMLPGGLHRDRIAVDKTNVLLSAEQLLVAHARTTSRGAVLEVSFEGDKGSGTGVIREFFSLVAHALQEECDGADTSLLTSQPPTSQSIASGSAVWYSVDMSASAVPDRACRIVHHPAGLFPRPLAVVSRPVLRACGIVGRMIGQALLDGRVFPLPLSVVLFSALLRLVSTNGRTLLPTLEPHFNTPNADAAPADAPPADTAVCAVRAAARGLLRDSLFVDVLRAYLPHVASAMLPAALSSAEAHASLKHECSPSGAAIDDIGLTFEHPETGADLTAVDLAMTGRNRPRASDLGLRIDSCVTTDLIDIYVASLVAYTAWGSGVRGQLLAIYTGINEIVQDMRWLHLIGTPEDVRDLVCGSPRVDWTAQELSRHVVASHGYSHSDAPVRWFVAALVDMTQAERASFLQFATGQPVLPPGGVAGLSPPLTIIRKTDGISAGRKVRSSNDEPHPPGPYDRLWLSSSTCFHQVRASRVGLLG